MKKYIVMSVLFTALVAGCSPESKYPGTWVQPIPGQETLLQGVILEKGGKASSVNMQTLLYENWTLQGDSLVLTGKSVGNGQTVEFAENFIFKKENGKQTIQTEDGTLIYYKQK